MRALIQPYIEQQAILGAAVAVLQRGEIVYQRGFGATSIEEGWTEVTPRTLFAYGSICKTICATLVMRLVEQGLLHLDVPVIHYLPDLHFGDARYGREITLRHLLSHTSGLPMAGKYWGPRDPDALRRFVYEQIPHYAFLSPPGTVHHYSNAVFCIAGHVAEAVTGKFYDELVQEHVFDPLQMARATFDPAVALTYPLALPHERAAGGALRAQRRMPANASGHPSSFALGSVADLAHLAQMFLNHGDFGGQSTLSASSIAEMHTAYGSRHVAAAAHPLAHTYQGYGLGFFVGRYKGRKVARHGGMTLSYNCFFDLFPEEQAGVVLLTNYSREEPLLALVAALYDRALDLPQQGFVYLEKPAAFSAPRDGKRWQEYRGAYLHVEAGDLATFLVEGDDLILQRQGERLPLVPFAADDFYAEVGQHMRLPVAFVRDASGEIAAVMIGGQPYYPWALDATFRPQPRRWQAYAGLYKDPSNSNREDILSVRVQDGVLFVAEGAHEVPCRAIGNRSFLSDLGLIEFEGGDVEGVKVLVLAKATRYYPLHERAYRAGGVIRYLVEVPQAPARVPAVRA